MPEPTTASPSANPPDSSLSSSSSSSRTLIHTPSSLSYYPTIIRHYGIFPVMITRFKLTSLTFILISLILLQTFALLIIAKMYVPFFVALAGWIATACVLCAQMLWFYRCRVREARDLDQRIDERLAVLEREVDAEEANEETPEAQQESTTTTSTSPMQLIASLMQRMSPSSRSPRASRSFTRHSRRLETRMSDNSDFSDQWLTNILAHRQRALAAQGRTRDPSAEHINQQLQHILTHLRLSMNDGNFTPEEYERLLRLDSHVSSPKGLNRHQIDRFPTFKVTPESSALDERCNICMEDYVVDETLMTLGCFHFFHEACVRQWLSEESKKCPICMNNALVTEESAGVDLFGGDDAIEMDPVQMPFEYSGRRQEHHGNTFVDL